MDKQSIYKREKPKCFANTKINESNQQHLKQTRSIFIFVAVVNGEIYNNPVNCLLLY